ncbi:MAG: 6-phospho-beta-glucosidase, partial [Anaerolineae bacterium]|nr:6-phospho-beta-glucosidase [Anaerolineae bacterium]
AGLNTEALSRYAPDVPAVGVCNVPITTKMSMLKRLGIDAQPAQAKLNTLGLNHLTWHRGFTVDGEDLWPQVLEGFIDEQRASSHSDWDLNTIESLRMIPNYYLRYFYYTDQQLAEQEKWPPSRAEAVMQIEDELFKQYAEPDRTVPPDGLMKRGGAYYSTLATQLLNAHYNNLGEVHEVNVPHRGAVPGYPPDWVMEMPCTVDAKGIHPLPTDPLPLSCFGLVAQIKSYEILTVEAAVHGDKNAAYQALLTHPLGPTADKVEAVLDDLLETNRKYLPQFFSRA